MTSEEYIKCRELNRHIRNTKKRLASKIIKMIAPYMWKAGYDKKILVFVNDKYYKPKGLSKSLFAISGEYCGICGFMEDGNIITDAYGGALSTQHVSTLCVEDLICLYNWVDCNITKFKHSFNFYTKD